MTDDWLERHVPRSWKVRRWLISTPYGKTVFWKRMRKQPLLWHERLLMRMVTDPSGAWPVPISVDPTRIKEYLDD